MYKMVILIILLFPVITLAQLSPISLGGGASADSIKDIAIEDTTGNLADNDVPTYDLGSNTWKFEAPPGAGGGETNTASNQGSGTSIYYQKSGVDLQFNAIKSETDDMSVALDGTSHDVEFTFNPGSVAATELSDGSNVAHINANETVTGNWVNTDNPWADNEIATSGNWNTAFGWGDHAGLYPTTTDFGKVTDDTTNYQTAYTHSQVATGNPHSLDTDDVPEGTNKYDQALPDSGNWSDAYSWGDHLGLYPTTTDFGKVTDDTTNYQTAYGWGNHSTQNYLDVDDANVDTSQWRQAYGWGDHSGQNYLDDDVSGDVDADDIGTGEVGDDEIDYANVTFADFDYQSNWSMFYSDASGDVQELDFSTQSGEFLRSNGSAAPTFEPGGAGETNVLSDTGTFNGTEGFGLAGGKTGVALKVKGVIEGSNITITTSGDSAIVITASGGSGVWTEGTDTLFAIDSDGDTVAAFWDDDAGNVRWQVATEDQTLRILLDSLGIGGDLISELAGTGLTVVSNELTVDLGTAVDGSELDTGLKDSITVAYDSSQVLDGVRDDIRDTVGVVDIDPDNLSGDAVDNNKVDSNIVNNPVSRAVEDASGNVITTTYAPLDDPTITTGITVPNDAISAAELNEGDNFTWAGTHDFSGATSLEIPNSDNPTTDANGEFAADNNANAHEVYIPSESESGLMPFYKHWSIPIVLPDSVQVYSPNLHILTLNQMVYPYGIEIDSISIQLDADAAYEMVIEEWSGADPPVYQNDISTVTTGETDTYAIEAPDTDGNLDAGDKIYLDLPTTDVPKVTVEIFYHVTEGN